MLQIFEAKAGCKISIMVQTRASAHMAGRLIAERQLCNCISEEEYQAVFTLDSSASSQNQVHHLDLFYQEFYPLHSACTDPERDLLSHKTTCRQNLYPFELL